MTTQFSRFKIGGLPDLVDRLRGLSIRGHSQTLPYSDANISVERVDISRLVPLSKYVLEEQVRFVESARRSMLLHSVDIFHLDCGLVWPDGDSGRPFAVPIVEEWDGALQLVDGLHRVWTARAMELETVTCAVLRQVEVPLMTLPASWDEVKVFPPGQYPAAHEKRNYRFTDPDAVKAAAPAYATFITPSNYRYFLYRDLAKLGSDGVRTEPSTGT